MNAITNKRPSYYVEKYYRRKMNGSCEVVENKFNIVEFRDGETCTIATLNSKSSDLLDQMLKRGIPRDDAKNLMYGMQS